MNPVSFFLKHFTFLMVLTMLAAPTISQAKGLPPYQDLQLKWNQPYPPFQITERFYYVGSSLIAVFLIDTGDGLVLIDSGVAKKADVILANIETLGFKVSDIKIMLSTHAHFDHIAGHAQIKKESGAEVWASAADTRLFESGGAKSFFPFYEFPKVKVDKIVKNGDKFSVGKIGLEMVFTPGHTEGATSWLITLPNGEKNTKVMVASSLSVNEGVLLRDNKEWPQVLTSYQESFKRLREIKTDIFLTAHSNLFEMEAKRSKLKKPGKNPFIDPLELQKYVNENEANFLRLLK